MQFTGFVDLIHSDLPDPGKKISRCVYIHQVQLSRVTCQDLSYLASILANTNGLLVLYLHHLANTLTNSNDKADNFTKEDDNLIPQQVDDTDRYGIDRVRR